MTFVKFTREQIKNMGAFQFKEGDVIKTGKYYIHIKYGNYTIPSLKTTVNTENSMVDLKLSKIPYYISDFINRLPEELKSKNIWEI